MKCIVPGCKNSHHTRHTRKAKFHTIPKDPKEAEKWMQILGIPFSGLYSRSLRVCSVHFAPGDYFKQKNGIFLKDKVLPKPLSQTSSSPNNTIEVSEVDSSAASFATQENDMDMELNIASFVISTDQMQAQTKTQEACTQTYPEDVDMQNVEQKDSAYYINLVETTEKVSINRAMDTTDDERSGSPSPTRHFLRHKKLKVLRGYIKNKLKEERQMKAKIRKQADALVNCQGNTL